ncbi:hypothetical protein EDM58_15290 [Brevibacillus panacihumi]|uniref:Uncharacterized protein n=1 Tax=Brevibacillus panacihumi TaxID=497735 RepID=A0A3M8CP34_9BACL|nr:hypothetical protein EDM58_15290 [Brevibacillus panacihumi]
MARFMVTSSNLFIIFGPAAIQTPRDKGMLQQPGPILAKMGRKSEVSGNGKMLLASEYGKE